MYTNSPLLSGLLFLVMGIVWGSISPPAQAQELPTTPVPPAYEPIVGTWQGDLTVPGGMSLAMVFHIELDEEGDLTASADSPDQGVQGMAVESVRFEDGRVELHLPSISGRFEGLLEEPESLKGTWFQGGAELPLEMSRVDEVVRPERPQEPEPPFPYAEEEVRYPNPQAEIQLEGTLTIPEGSGPFPAVALISGSGAQNRDLELFGHRPFKVLADHLTQRGIAVLRSDDRGVGGSEGDFSEATTRDFADDAAAAVTYLRSHPEVDPGAVGLVGLSEGGLIAPMVAVDSPEVAFIVLLAGPGLPGEEILYRQGELISQAMGASEDDIQTNLRLQERLFRIVVEEEDDDARKQRLETILREALADMSEEERAALGSTGEAEDGWVRSQLASLSGPWFRYFLMHDPRPVLRQVQVPVLALNGELDLQVPPAENLAAIEAALREGGNEAFVVRELPGLNHLFQTAETGAPAEYSRIEETMSPEAMELVAQWILEQTQRIDAGADGAGHHGTLGARRSRLIR